MKQFYILLIVLFQIFNISITADTGINPELEINEAGVANNHPWPLYTLEDGTTPIQIRFPKAPSKNAQNGVITYTSVESSAFPLVIYNLSYSANETDVDPDDIYEEFLSHFSTKQFAVVQADIDYLEEYCEMNFFVVDLQRRVARKETIFVTDDNVYHLYTIYFLNSVQNHSAFVKSFTFL
jgi:RNA recognition motif-containing protein